MKKLQLMDIASTKNGSVLTLITGFRNSHGAAACRSWRRESFSGPRL